MKLTIREADVRQVICEVLAELEPKARLSVGSLDDQIDSLLIKFEKESTEGETSSATTEDLEIRPTLRFLLEADPAEEDEAEPPEDDAPDTDADDEESGPDTTADSQDQTAAGPAEPNKPKIDISQFTLRVVRLLDHTQSLLDLETVVINRAKKFLADNYGDPAATEFEQILDNQYGVSLEPRDDEPERPMAVGAGPTA